MNFETSVREIVNSDYRTADVFRKWGINYCCSGNMMLADVCKLQGLDLQMIIDELQKATTHVTIANTVNYTLWPLDFLTDYIIHIHHAYIRQASPELAGQIAGFYADHKNKFGYLSEVKQLFAEIIEEKLAHLNTEEQVLFPYIRQIYYTHTRKEVYGKLFVRTLRKPLEQIVDREHTRISGQIQHLRTLTNNYTPPDNACSSLVVIYLKLKEFDLDLVQHMHLENNVLMPKAIELEKALLH